ncbi:MAG TPA: DUF4388 domain-containing protein [Thermoanaerobaculia bacterium]|nr:DUF4388 domain-containing protein [Thermoanaerobaculia bacterium]
MAVEGTLDLFQLPEILQLISQQKKTGILTVQGQNDIVAISFLNGRIVAADALNQTMEEGLTRVLVAEGMLTQQELSRALSEHTTAGGRLLDFLVERRYVSRQKLLAALRLQTYGLIEQLLRWDQGDFKFYSGEEVSYEEAFVPITVEELLLNSAEPKAAKRPSAASPGPLSPPSYPSPSSQPPVATGPAAPAGRAAKPASPPLRAVPPLEPPPPPAMPAMPPMPPMSPISRSAEAATSRRAARPVEVPPAAISPVAPPGDLPTVFRRMTVEELAVPLSFRTVARLLAGAAVALLVFFLLRGASVLFLPFPWEEAQRQSLAQEQRSALYLKVDRASKTYFLLEGRFPERLGQLQQLHLLSGADLTDPQGYELHYSAQAESYRVQPVDSKGGKITGTEATDAVSGNFLLDSEFISVSPDTQTPLVLLD